MENCLFRLKLGQVGSHRPRETGNVLAEHGGVAFDLADALVSQVIHLDDARAHFIDRIDLQRHCIGAECFLDAQGSECVGPLPLPFRPCLFGLREGSTFVRGICRGPVKRLVQLASRIDYPFVRAQSIGRVFQHNSQRLAGHGVSADVERREFVKNAGSGVLFLPTESGDLSVCRCPWPDCVQRLLTRSQPLKHLVRCQRLEWRIRPHRAPLGIEGAKLPVKRLVFFAEAYQEVLLVCDLAGSDGKLGRGFGVVEATISEVVGRAHRLLVCVRRSILGTAEGAHLGVGHEPAIQVAAPDQMPSRIAARPGLREFVRRDRLFVAG